MVIYYTHSYGNRKGESHRLLQLAITRYLTENGYRGDAAETESAALTASLRTEGEYGKPVIAMEPCKGGTLVNIPLEARELMKQYAPDASPASWAMR